MRNALRGRKVLRWACSVVFVIGAFVVVDLVGFGGLSLSAVSRSATVLTATARASRPLRRTLPSCLIIGVRKGGTRALIDMMALHSKIKAARTEVHFFDFNENYEKGYAWYRHQMPAVRPGEIAVEKSPSYFVSDSVPRRVFQMNANISLILVVRDPVTRLISDYAQIIENQRYRGLEGRPFESVALNPDGSVNEHYDAVEKSIYSLHMAKWLKVFPHNQMHVVNGEKLVRKPWHELRKVEDFLGLEHEIEPEMFAFNATKGFHCIVATGNDSVRRERCLTKAKGRVHPRIGKEVISKLRKFFAPFNYDFYTMAGADFGWPEH